MRYRARLGVPSENGWTMIPYAETVAVEVVPAAKKVPLRIGDVATILNAFIIAYNRDVEPITSQVWGWSADNDVPNSNHMSGTAIDINAPKYPWGTKYMPADRVAKVRKLLQQFGGVVYWGGDWSKPDQMHYQIGLPPNDRRVRALADKLNNGYLNIYQVETPREETSVNFTDYAKLSFEQLAGYGYDKKTRKPTFQGWKQLGDRTLVDAIAAIGAHLGIDGMYDPKSREK